MAGIIRNAIVGEPNIDSPMTLSPNGGASASAAGIAVPALDATQNAAAANAESRASARRKAKPFVLNPSAAATSNTAAVANPPATNTATPAATTASTPASSPAATTAATTAATPASSLIPLQAASSTDAKQSGMGYTASTVGATGYNAQNVNAPADMQVAANQTVQGQLSGILASNSPLLQHAYNQAMVGMNDRGLVNSSTAIGAAQNAVYDKAVPIATTDAGTYQNTALANFNAATQNAQLNANAANQASQFNAGAQNTAGLQNASFKNSAAQFGANAQNQSNLQAAQLASSESIAAAARASQESIAAANNATALQQTQLSTSTQLSVAQLSANTQLAVANMNSATQKEISAAHDANSVLLNNSSAATSMFNQYLTNVGNIDANPNMDMAAKEAAIKTQTDVFNGAVKGLTAASPGVPDVSSVLDFSPKPAATATATTAPAADAAAGNGVWLNDGSS